jgi:tripartite-type tricarboxylate transporter receptor subunit TctC
MQQLNRDFVLARNRAGVQTLFLNAGMAALPGQQPVIDNRCGADGRNATDVVVSAARGGYAVFMTSLPCLALLHQFK